MRHVVSLAKSGAVAARAKVDASIRRRQEEGCEAMCELHSSIFHSCQSTSSTRPYVTGRAERVLRGGTSAPGDGLSDEGIWPSGSRECPIGGLNVPLLHCVRPLNAFGEQLGRGCGFARYTCQDDQTPQPPSERSVAETLPLRPTREKSMTSKGTSNAWHARGAPCSRLPRSTPCRTSSSR